MKRSTLLSLLLVTLALSSVATTSAQQESTLSETPARSARRDPRAVVEAFVAAVLTGRVSDALALAESGKAPSSAEEIGKMQEMLNVRSLKITTVLWADKEGRALAISAPVTMTKPNPDGQDTGCLAFQVIQSGGGWRIKDIDFETAVGKTIEQFKQDHQKVSEIPSARVSTVDSIATGGIPSGHRVFMIKPVPHTGVTRIVRPGDYVAVLLMQVFEHEENTTIETKLIVPSIRVFSVDRTITRGGPDGWATDVALVGTAEQHQMISAASKLGKLHLTSPIALSAENENAVKAIDVIRVASDLIADAKRTEPADLIAQQYRELGQGNATAKQLADMKKELRIAVVKAFEARQQVQRDELVRLQQRLMRIQRLIESRDQIKDKIIDHRVEELLNPALRWNDPEETNSKTTTSNSVSDAGHTRLVPQGVRAIREKLSQRWRLVEQQFKSGEAALGDVLNAAKQFHEAEAATATTPQERRDAQQRQLNNLREIVQNCKARYKAGEGSLTDVLAAEAELLKVEAQSSPVSTSETPRTTTNNADASPAADTTIVLTGDSERIQGVWNCVSYVQCGKPVSATKLKIVSISFSGRGFSIVDGERARIGRFKLWPDKTPRRIDLTETDNPKGGSQLGIYEFRDDQLWICMSDNAERPTAFESKLKTPSTFFMRFERTKVGVDVERKLQQGNAAIKLPDGVDVESFVWDVLGVRLRPSPLQEHSRYRGGMLITQIRQDSPAAKAAMREDDVLVGLHHWETLSNKNVAFALGSADHIKDLDSKLKFYILRGNETLYGTLMLHRSDVTSVENNGDTDPPANGQDSNEGSASQFDWTTRNTIATNHSTVESTCS